MSRVREGEEILLGEGGGGGRASYLHNKKKGGQDWGEPSLMEGERRGCRDRSPRKGRIPSEPA